MRKIVMGMVLSMLVLIWCGVVFSQQEMERPAAADILRRLEQIESKIERLGQSSREDNFAAVLAKLDQVLENQRQIARELEVIRVRVSRK